METQTIFEQPYVALCIDPEIPAIFETWKGQVTGHEFLALLEEKLLLFNTYRERYPQLQWLTDIRGLRGISSEDQAWATQVFHPKLYQSGVRQVAFVVPEEAYLRLSDEQLLGHMDSRKEVKLRYFDAFEEAAEWLRQAAHADV